MTFVYFLLVYIPLLFGLVARSKKEEHPFKFPAYEAAMLGVLVFALSYMGIIYWIFVAIGVVAKWLGYIALEIGIIVLAVRLSGIPFSEMGDRLAVYLEQVDRDARKMEMEKMRRKQREQMPEDHPAPENAGSVK